VHHLDEVSGAVGADVIDGPCRAPSSPPEMPVPTKFSPFSRSSRSRRMVSWKFAFPPSTMMSPSSNRSESCPMTASVPLPACTMMIAVRGFDSDATKPSMSSDAMKPASPCSCISSSVRA
jgi:hypothetical protein